MIPSGFSKGQEIELQCQVSLSQTSSKKKMKIHFICEHFHNRIKYGPLAPYLYFVLENHRD